MARTAIPDRGVRMNPGTRVECKAPGKGWRAGTVIADPLGWGRLWVRTDADNKGRMYLPGDVRVMS